MSKEAGLSISFQELAVLAGHIVGQAKEIFRIARGSTNEVYFVRGKLENCIIKIANRPDRIKGKVLGKEAKMLKFLERKDWPIPIPQILWEGKTSGGYPVIIETALAGECVEDIVHPGIDVHAAAATLGRCIATLHGYAADTIDEFEVGRNAYTNFPTYARASVAAWQPLLEKIDFIPSVRIEEAGRMIEERLLLFGESSFVYVHADISKENLLGMVQGNILTLTGLCDFETVQTAPPEYDFATIENGIFLMYSDWEKPFYEGYQSLRRLHAAHIERLRAMRLFRALRYIKRTHKYRETQYMAYARRFLEKALNT